MVRVEKENGQYNLEISTLRRELETTKKAYEQQCLQMESQTKVATAGIEDRVKELEKMRKDASIAKFALEERVKELEELGKKANAAKTTLEEKVKELQQFKKESITVTSSLEAKNRKLEQFKKETITVNASLEAKNRELEQNLVHWKSKAKEMEEKSELKNRSWSQKELSYRSFISFQFQALQVCLHIPLTKFSHRVCLYSPKPANFPGVEVLF